MNGPSYVILEWNQASGMPSLADNELYDDPVEAAEQAAELTRQAAPRLDRYTVHPLDLAEAVRWRNCPTCQGKGGTSGTGPTGPQDADCGACKGRGVELVDQEEGR